VILLTPGASVTLLITLLSMPANIRFVVIGLSVLFVICAVIVHYCHLQYYLPNLKQG